MIPVTKAFLPPQEEYHNIISKIWESGWLTNRGILVQELEEKLLSFLGVANLIATTNGTLPLQIAIKALKLKGEIITTPFSYVATTSSIVWEGCKPVFVDIHPEYLTIDEDLIQNAITSDTSAILATHVFGNPCNIEAISRVAEKYKLKVIYDAAHAFGVDYKGKSLLNYGDISTCSFHATKLFHTGEGGAIISKDENVYKECFQLHNFGHLGQEDFSGLGINAKMSELQAGMGLAVFHYLPRILQDRRRINDFYRKELKGLDLQLLKIRENTESNFSYFPVIFREERLLLKVKERLEEIKVFPRRYFYPSLNNLPYTSIKGLPVSESIASRILCLPVYYDLETKNLEKIVEVLKSYLKC